MKSNPINLVIQFISTALLVLLGSPLHAQTPEAPNTANKTSSSKHVGDNPQTSVLTRDEWRRVDSAVARALDWLAKEQQTDGSFPTVAGGQPGVTSLCTLAFMAHGHNPGEGKYGERLERAAAFIMSGQKQNGLIAVNGPDRATIDRDVSWEIGVTMAYNHAISSLTLSEIYGMGKAKRAEPVQRAIDKSLAATLAMQQWHKDRDADKGGWRYILDFDDKDSDLSLTGWNLMFLRSARNAGFDVSKQSIDDAVAYIRRTFAKEDGVFIYTTATGDCQSRGMAGAGILALAHAGYHDSEEAKQSGEWLLRHPFTEYNGNNGIRTDRYHYSLFNACYGMYQLGGPAWTEFFPPTVRTLLASQDADGSWDAESFQRDRIFGKAYTTAMVVLSLGAPNQFLPVFQR
jgi:hypothetical protein